MSTINTLRELLDRSLDEPLSTADRQRLAAGLAQYAELRTEQEKLLRLRATLSTLHPDGNPAFVNRVMSSVREERYVLRPLVQQWRAVAAVACLVLLAAASIISSGGSDWEVETILGLEDMELDDVYAFDE